MYCVVKLVKKKSLTNQHQPMDPLQRLSEFNKQNITTKKKQKKNKKKTRGTENNGKEKKLL